MNKRRILLIGLALLVSAFALRIAFSSESAVPAHEAMFYEKLPDGRVECGLCPRRCVIAQGQRGACRNRENRDGTLYSVVYGKPCTVTVEPIEKAPFYHFLPGNWRLCTATVGCNLHCKYCQNWQISQRTVEEVDYRETPPDVLVAQARKESIPIICFTFSEPTSFYEYMYDTAKLAHEAGIKTAVVSNGFINPAPLRQLLTVVDAIRIDLKGFTEEFYEEVTGGRLGPVLETLKTIHQSGKHLEIINLVVPTYNDDPETIRKMCQWIKDNLGVEHPIHFTRFFPQYRMTHLTATPVSALERAAEVAQEVGLQYVYIGNVPGHPLNNTYCPQCHALLIRRAGFQILENLIRDGKCPSCEHVIPGVWSVNEPARENKEGAGSSPASAPSTP
ncbi:MAG: AmmeMemoRadiSam system radical SAM enzyme [Planctomycetota bacterium]